MGDIKFNMSKVYRHGTGQNSTYTDQNGNVVFKNGNLTPEASAYMKSRGYNSSYINRTVQNMRVGNVWDTNLKNTKYGGWRIDNGLGKNRSWNSDIQKQALAKRNDIATDKAGRYMFKTADGKYLHLNDFNYKKPAVKVNQSAAKNNQQPAKKSFWQDMKDYYNVAPNAPGAVSRVTANQWQNNAARMTKNKSWWNPERSITENIVNDLSQYTLGRKLNESGQAAYSMPMYMIPYAGQALFAADTAKGFYDLYNKGGSGKEFLSETLFALPLLKQFRKVAGLKGTLGAMGGGMGLQLYKTEDEARKELREMKQQDPGFRSLSKKAQDQEIENEVDNYSGFQDWMLYQNKDQARRRLEKYEPSFNQASPEEQEEMVKNFSGSLFLKGLSQGFSSPFE